MPRKYSSTSKFAGLFCEWSELLDYFPLSRDSCLERYNWFDWNNTGKMVLPDSTLKYIAANRDKDMEAATKVGGHH